jgi:hypothetical protein
MPEERAAATKARATKSVLHIVSFVERLAPVSALSTVRAPFIPATLARQPLEAPTVPDQPEVLWGMRARHYHNCSIH